MKAFVFLVIIMYCGSIVADCNVVHDLPLVTHYSKITQSFLLGGTDAPNSFYNQNAVEEYKSGQNPVYYYANQYIPNREVGLASNYDDQSYSDEFVINALKSICVKTGISFELRQPNIELENANQLKEIIKSNYDNGQIIHSIVFRNNLFSIIIPPNWNSHKKHRLLLNGFYGLNSNLFTQEGPSVLNILSAHDGIGVLWNGGGAVSTYTTSVKNYQDLNDFLEIIIPVLNLDRNNVVVFGNSRGAYTALNIASNPIVSSIKVKFVWATNPFNNIDLITELTSVTVPKLLMVSDYQKGFYGTWDKSFVYNESSHHDEDLTVKDKLNKLKYNKTEIYLYVGTHDEIVPTVVKTELFEIYRRSGIKVQMGLYYLNAHLPNRAIRDIKLHEVFGNSKSHNIIKNKVSYFIQDNNSNVKLKSYNKYNAPFILELPRYMNDNITAHIIAKGRPNTEYTLKFDITEIVIKTDRYGYYIKKLCAEEFPIGDSVLQDITINNKKLALRNSSKTATIIVTRDNTATRKLLDSPIMIIQNLINGINNERALTLDNKVMYLTHGIVAF